MEKRRKAVFWVVLLSETSHIFCCVLPSVFSIMALLAGVGMISVMPAPLNAVHEFMHGWELPMIAASGLILLLGWVIDIYSRRVDCHDTGCGHPPCGERKDKAHLILKIATVLFFTNLMVYAVLHQGWSSGEVVAIEVEVDHEVDHEADNNHDH